MSKVVMMSHKVGKQVGECGGSLISGSRQVSPEDRSALWAMLTFHGGGCQLNLNKKCTHLVVPEPKGVSDPCTFSFKCLLSISSHRMSSLNFF